MKKSELLEILNQYEEDVPIKVEYRGCDMEIETGDLFHIKDAELTDKIIWLQI